MLHRTRRPDRQWRATVRRLLRIDVLQDVGVVSVGSEVSVCVWVAAVPPLRRVSGAMCCRRWGAVGLASRSIHVILLLWRLGLMTSRNPTGQRNADAGAWPSPKGNAPVAGFAPVLGVGQYRCSICYRP